MMNNFLSIFISSRQSCGRSLVDTAGVRIQAGVAGIRNSDHSSSVGLGTAQLQSKDNNVV